MRIVIPVKWVPDTAGEKQIDPASLTVDRASVASVLCPVNEFAIEEAVRIKEARGADVETVVLIVNVPLPRLSTCRTTSVPACTRTPPECALDRSSTSEPGPLLTSREEPARVTASACSDPTPTVTTQSSAENTP
jgi:hypothetical protein